MGKKQHPITMKYIMHFCPGKATQTKTKTEKERKNTGALGSSLGKGRPTRPGFPPENDLAQGGPRPFQHSPGPQPVPNPPPPSGPAPGSATFPFSYFKSGHYHLHRGRTTRISDFPDFLESCSRGVAGRVRNPSRAPARQHAPGENAAEMSQSEPFCGILRDLGRPAPRQPAENNGT